MPAHTPSPESSAARLNLRGIACFLAIAFSLGWLLDLPIVLDGNGLESPWAALVLLRNFTPGIATLLVTRWLSPLPNTRKVTGLRRGVKGSRWGWHCLFALLAIPYLFYVAIPLSAAALGLAELDLVGFSGYRALWASLPGGADFLSLAPIDTLALVALATLPLMALVTTPFTFGEEWGWRGYLLPQLLPLGQWRALVLTGVIWGLWHFPLYHGIVYGPGQPLLVELTLFAVFATLWGVVLGWMQLATRSLWPAVLAHAAINSGQNFFVGSVFAKAGVTYDPLVASHLGLAGWIVPLALIAVLVLTRQLPVRVAEPAEPAGANGSTLGAGQPQNVL